MKVWWKSLIATQTLWLTTVQTFAEGINVPTDNSLIEFAKNRADAVQVTQKPFRMDDTAVFYCISPTPDVAQEQKHHLSNPHRSKYVQVYVSALGKTAMFATNSMAFPVGTVILKEKFSDSTGQSTELYTGMVKHEKGFNPDCGDWEFFTLNSDASKITARGKLQDCMGCHVDYKGTDFVTKKYVTDTR